MKERFGELRKMGIRTVMITGDNPLTAKAIADESGVDDYLAEATPEDKMALIRKEQEGGRLISISWGRHPATCAGRLAAMSAVRRDDADMAPGGGVVVPSAELIATSRPPSCSLRIRPSCPRAWPRRGSRPHRTRRRSPLAVNGLSPVIMTVRMPILRSSPNRSFIAGLTTSDSRITPSTVSFSATTRGVPPCALISSTMRRASSLMVNALAAPLRIRRAPSVA